MNTDNGSDVLNASEAKGGKIQRRGRRGSRKSRRLPGPKMRDRPLQNQRQRQRQNQERPQQSRQEQRQRQRRPPEGGRYKVKSLRRAPLFDVAFLFYFGGF